MERSVTKPLGWFIASWICCWPLALVSFARHWSKIDPSEYRGDVAAAQQHAWRVRTYGIVSVVLLALLVIAFGVVIVSFSTKPCSPDGHGNLINC